MEAEARPRPRVPLSRRLEVTALWALLVLTVRQQIRGRKGLFLVGVYLLACVIALALRTLAVPVSSQVLEFDLIFTLVPQALAPLTALLYASGMIQDEVEEQTLTYLLVRPLPRWALYLTKWLGTLFVSMVLTAFMSTLLLLAAHWGDESIGRTALLERAWKVAVLLSLAQLTYCSVFAGLSLLFRRSLILGVAYVVVLEGFVSKIDFIVRLVTVMFYYRVLSLRWLDLTPEQATSWRLKWHIDLETAPSLENCVLILVCASLIVTALSTLRFSLQEFRMKTPEST